MQTDEFIDAVAPEGLYMALEPITPPAGEAACSAHDPQRFSSPDRQQAAFDGDPVDPAHDYPAARAICIGCPVLAACRRYADASRDEITFLAGQSAEQRLTRRAKRAEIAKRRLQVAALDVLGAPTAVVAELLGRDPSLIRGDLRELRRERSAI